MDRNTILFIVLTFFIIIGFQALNKPQVKPQAPATQAAGAANATAAANVTAPAAAATAVATAPAVVTNAVAVRLVRVDTPFYTAVFSTQGATLESFALHKYTMPGGEPVMLLTTPSADSLRALAIGSDDSYALGSANFEVDADALKLDDNKKEGKLTFRYADGAGRSVTRTITFKADSYGFEVADAVAGLPDYRITLGSRFGIHDRSGMTVHVGPVLLVDSDREELKYAKLDPAKTFTGRLKWVALEDNYFFSAIVPESPVREARAWQAGKEAAIGFAADAGAEHKFYVHAGPKSVDMLKPLGKDLEHVVDFGFFSIISRPLFWLLKFINGFIGNYGWSIIVLTIVIRIPFIPLTNMGQRSMKKMAALQPQIKAINEKYKDNPEKKTRETMELYKKHQVNPVSGCLPILIQIPIFFALYKVLLVAVELRGAPFAFWIHDLAAKDPMYVLPILMGLSMLVQQKLTPSTMDPMQQKIMMALPIIFTVMFLSFPAGLVLYWFVSNLLSITQQIYVNRQKDEPQGA